MVDPSHRITDDEGTIRNKLTSSVDMLRMLVSLGHNGSSDWITGGFAELYGRRHNMIPMLRSAEAPGRPYVLWATDEDMLDFFNFLSAPAHIYGFRTEDTKLGVYAKWFHGTDVIDQSTVQMEFYDYSTDAGCLELKSTPKLRELSRCIQSC